MQPLPHPSVTPLPSWAVERPPFSPPPIKFPGMLAAVLGWLAGRRPTRGQRQREDNIVCAMAKAFDAEAKEGEAS
jgi:hypothetical protein